MSLLHHLGELLDRAAGDRGAGRLVVALEGRCVGRAPIPGAFLQHAVAADRRGQEAFGGLRIALLRAEQVKRLAHVIDSPRARATGPGP
jgi:hypothetical protein